MRKKYVIANFKMNKTDGEVNNYLTTLIPAVVSSKAEVCLAVPSVSIKTAVERVKDTNISIAGQNINVNDFGAFTGEINAEMVRAVGAKAVLVGHSERRNLFKEDDKLVNKKIQKALKSGLVAIFCMGETMFDRKGGNTEKVLLEQILTGLNSIYTNELKNIIIAYEPVWAIGTGVTATNKEIEEAIKNIRKALSQMYDKEIANEVSIIYGGSINENNIKDIIKIKDIDGVLVGGASLVPEKFIKIVNSF